MNSDHEPFNVTLLAGDTCSQFDVPINDSVLEDDAANNFTLIINPSSLPSNINVGDTYQATVIIRDNCKYKNCYPVFTSVINNYICTCALFITHCVCNSSTRESS